MDAFSRLCTTDRYSSLGGHDWRRWISWIVPYRFPWRRLNTSSISAVVVMRCSQRRPVLAIRVVAIRYRESCQPPPRNVRSGTKDRRCSNREAKPGKPLRHRGWVRLIQTRGTKVTCAYSASGRASAMGLVSENRYGHGLGTSGLA